MPYLAPFHWILLRPRGFRIPIPQSKMRFTVERKLALLETNTAPWFAMRGRLLHRSEVPLKHVRNAPRSAILALSLAFSFMALTPQAAYAAPSTKQSSSVLVQGTTAALSGVLEITHFTTQNNQLVATGVLNGTVTSASGTVSQLTNAAAQARRRGRTRQYAVADGMRWSRGGFAIPEIIT